MGNTLLTPTIIAREAVMALVNNLVLGNLVHRDFEQEFAQVGDTITVRKPATFTANTYGGTTITKQDATEGSVAVKMDTILDVSFAVTSKQMSLDVRDFNAQFITPAMQAHAQAIDELIAKRYVDIPYFVDSTSTAVIGDIANIGAKMSNNKVPMADRRLVLNPTTYAQYVALDAVLHAEKSGSTQAVRDASIGRVLGLDCYQDQNIQSHTAGTGTVKADLVAGYTKGTWNAGKTGQDIHVDGVTTALKVGDLLTIASNQYVIVAAGELSTADQDITIYPTLAADLANDGDITVHATGSQNLAFHKNAFALVTRPLAKPQGAAKSEVISYGGVSVRAVYDYDMDLKSDIISLDCLVGVKTLTPELACRFVRA